MIADGYRAMQRNSVAMSVGMRKLLRNSTRKTLQKKKPINWVLQHRKKPSSRAGKQNQWPRTNSADSLGWNSMNKGWSIQYDVRETGHGWSCSPWAGVYTEKTQPGLFPTYICLFSQHSLDHIFFRTEILSVTRLKVPKAFLFYFTFNYKFYLQIISVFTHLAVGGFDRCPGDY